MVQNNMPWIAAIIIGILSAFVNFWLSNKLRESNEKNLQTQFKSTLSTKNRQEWLNEVRISIGEAITQSRMIYLERSKSERNIENISKHVEKYIFSDSKIKLLLNDSNENQKAVLDAVNKLLDAAINNKNEDKANNEKINKDVLTTSRELIKIHWNKIKEGV